MLKALGFKKDECLICLDKDSKEKPLKSAFSVSNKNKEFCNHTLCIDW